MTKVGIFGLFAVVGAMASLPAFADVTVGTSGDPRIDLGVRLNTLLDAENKSVRKVHQRGFSKLIVAPKSETEGLYSRETLKSLPVAIGGQEW